MDLFHELDVTDLDMLKMQLGKLQMVGRLGYKKESEEFVDIMKGFRIIQNMAEYILEKIVSLEKILASNDLVKGYREITTKRCLDVKFPLTPMGVLAHRLRTLDRSLVPPSA